MGMYYVGSADWTTNLNSTNKKRENYTLVLQAFSKVREYYNIFLIV